MTLIVEDGTGRTDANSLVDVATADAYQALRANSAWAALSTAAKEAALVKASAFLSDAVRWPFTGVKKSGYAQRMPWPRTGVVERFTGESVPDNVVPWRVADAACELAASASVEDLNPALDRGGQIKSESVGPLSVTYKDGAPTGKLYSQVVGLLGPLLRPEAAVLAGTPYAGAEYVKPAWSGTTEQGDPFFDTGMHDNKQV